VARVEIRQLEELKVFDSLRLSVVLLLAVRCWDSLESYTSFSAQSLIESIYYYYLFYLLPDSVSFLGPYRLIPSIYRKNP
jgi:hypothetical protein